MQDIYIYLTCKVCLLSELYHTSLLKSDLFKCQSHSLVHQSTNFDPLYICTSAFWVLFGWTKNTLEWEREWGPYQSCKCPHIWARRKCWFMPDHWAKSCLTLTPPWPEGILANIGWITCLPCNMILKLYGKDGQILQIWIKKTWHKMHQLDWQSSSLMFCFLLFANLKLFRFQCFDPISVTPTELTIIWIY